MSPRITTFLNVMWLYVHHAANFGGFGHCGKSSGK